MHNDQMEIQQAWDIYYSVSYQHHVWEIAELTVQVFQRLQKQLKLLNVIELQYVSPKLLTIHDLDLAVPGTYESGKPVIGIGRILPTFQVINSKQRPRKFSMRGRDGKDYTYCLKGELDGLTKLMSRT